MFRLSHLPFIGENSKGVFLKNLYLPGENSKGFFKKSISTLLLIFLYYNGEILTVLIFNLDVSSTPHTAFNGANRAQTL